MKPIVTLIICLMLAAGFKPVDNALKVEKTLFAPCDDDPAVANAKNYIETPEGGQRAGYCAQWFLVDCYLRNGFYDSEEDRQNMVKLRDQIKQSIIDLASDGQWHPCNREGLP
jgi:hypothetical protein